MIRTRHFFQPPIDHGSLQSYFLTAVHTKLSCICLERHMNMLNVRIHSRNCQNTCKPGSVVPGFSSLAIIYLLYREANTFSKTRVTVIWQGGWEFHSSAWEWALGTLKHGQPLWEVMKGMQEEEESVRDMKTMAYVSVYSQRYTNNFCDT